MILAIDELREVLNCASRDAQKRSLKCEQLRRRAANDDLGFSRAPRRATGADSHVRSSIWLEPDGSRRRAVRVPARDSRSMCNTSFAASRQSALFGIRVEQPQIRNHMLFVVLRQRRIGRRHIGDIGIERWFPHWDLRYKQWAPTNERALACDTCAKV